MKLSLLVLVLFSCNFAAAYSAESDPAGSANQITKPAGLTDAPDKTAGIPADFMANAKSDELTIEQIMERALTAYGGKNELDKFRNDSFLKGSITFSQDKDAQFVYQHVRKNGCWRTYVAANRKNDTAEEGVRLNGFDGTSYWQSDRQRIEPLPADQANWLRVEENHKPFLLTTWLEPGYSFRLLGPTLFEQVPVWAIEVSQQNEPTTTLYLDKTNYLAIALSYRLAEPGDGKLVDVVWRYGEYRPCLSSVWPFEATEYIDDHQVVQLDISSCATANGVTHDFFSKPGGRQLSRLSRAITVPFDYSQGEIVLKGELDRGEQLLFLLDTGTSETIIDRRLAAQHVLAKGASSKISGFQGDVAAQTTTIARLKIGQLIVNDIDTKIADLSQQSQKLEKNIAGIIGMNVISNYLVTIDYGKPSLTFANALSDADAAHMTVVPLSDSRDPFVKVTLADKDGQELLMDTGAAFNHLAYAVARPHLPKDGLANSPKQATGLDGQLMQLGSVTIDPVRIGAQVVHKVLFTYPIEQEKSNQSNTIFGIEKAKIAGVLGNPFWQNFVVTLDMHSQQLWLRPNPTVGSKIEMDRNIINGDSALNMHRDFRLAEIFYQKALSTADKLFDINYQAIIQGRLGNLRRIMAHDLRRAEHAHSAYNYFSKADELARSAQAANIEGRILADWSLLYSDNGQLVEAKQTIDKALFLAPQDANVNVDYAVHLFRARSYAEMQTYIERALFLEPNNWQALWYQVKLSEMFADSNKEKETLAQIRKYYPWSKVAESKLKALTNPPVAKPPAGAAN